MRRTSLGEAVRRADGCTEDDLSDCACWRIEDTPEGFSRYEVVHAVTSVRAHTCLLGVEGETAGEEGDLRASNRRSVTTKHLVSALRPEFERHGRSWLQGDVKARIAEIDEGACANAGDYSRFLYSSSCCTCTHNHLVTCQVLFCAR
jgi:hypothetical protein